MIRATGNGTSLITDYDGRVLASRSYFSQSNNGIMLAGITSRGVATIYSRIGDLFAYACVASLAALAGLAFIHRTQPAGVAHPRPS
jgi:apolipoprotein N-acyltransferase